MDANISSLLTENKGLGDAKNLVLSLRNIKNVYSVNVLSVSTYDLIDCDSILIEKSALESLNLLLGLNNEK